MLLHWIQLCLLLTLLSMFFELPVFIPLVLYLIRSVSAEISQDFISRIRFKCSFLWPWENQYMVHGFDSISITQFPAMICSISAEGSLNRVAYSIWIFLLLTLSKSFCLICVHLLLDYDSAQLSHTCQISAARWESWYRKLEFCFTSFCFYYHRLWWSSWHADMQS